MSRRLTSLWKGEGLEQEEDVQEQYLHREEPTTSDFQAQAQISARDVEEFPAGSNDSVTPPRTELNDLLPAESMRLVYSTPLDTLHNTSLDLTPYFTEEQYRFIDADAFIKSKTLAIHEMSFLPNLYTVISYVWFGLPASVLQLNHDGSFHVSCGFRSDGTPREDGGPINLQVLEYACKWASDTSSSYVWLDRLCILQTSKKDKAWQISRMYDIYEQSRECVVLPGGLQCLASVFDETFWADRAWTYQEAIVTWEYAVVLTKDWHGPKGEQHWLVDGECHWQFLHQLFIEGNDLLTRQGKEERPRLIFGRNGQALDMLRRIMEYNAFNQLASEDEEVISEQTIRQHVLQGVAMRTSSRPVDMVFSILGLLGVQDIFQGHVHVSDFGEKERFRATLFLVEAVLRLEDDESDDSDSDLTALSNSMMDVPLWESLELLDNTKLPTLWDLAQLLDNDSTEHELSYYPKVFIKRARLLEWAFDVEQTEDYPSERASAIALKIPDNDLLSAYHGEQRVLVHHEEEGIIELCRKLELKSPLEDEVELTVVFGWSLKLEKHPYIRFYKFDISRLFL